MSDGGVSRVVGGWGLSGVVVGVWWRVVRRRVNGGRRVVVACWRAGVLVCWYAGVLMCWVAVTVTVVRVCIVSSGGGGARASR